MSKNRKMKEKKRTKKNLIKGPLVFFIIYILYFIIYIIYINIYFIYIYTLLYILYITLYLYCVYYRMIPRTKVAFPLKYFLQYSY